MPEFPIDLGRKMDGPTAVPSPSSSEKFYPTLHLDWDSDYKLPESGTMVIKFTKTNESNSKSRDGKKHQSVSLDITSIDKVSGGKSKTEKSDEDTGDALNRLKKEVESEKEDSEDETDY